ncbi:hypothetical protein [Streptomyces sp. NPDC005799]|uniref:hypothetical protein n=1 Tax=Streptomyces sp. NPDC005799 TaxID=3154678 RepID=UPI0033FBE5CE
MPVMVEVDCDDDKVTRVVTLPESVREVRDGMGHFPICDEKFVRRSGDDQPQVHAFCVGEPGWADDRFRVGGPADWLERWEESFGREETNDAYEEINPYKLRGR